MVADQRDGTRKQLAMKRCGRSFMGQRRSTSLPSRGDYCRLTAHPNMERIAEFSILLID
jgi:hypothetical protein